MLQYVDNVNPDMTIMKLHDFSEEESIVLVLQSIKLYSEFMLEKISHWGRSVLGQLFHRYLLPATRLMIKALGQYLYLFRSNILAL